jgi:hypothetical protein
MSAPSRNLDKKTRAPQKHKSSVSAKVGLALGHPGNPLIADRAQ